MLTCENLTIGYGAADVVHGASLEVQDGEIVGILGANGMGKTTLLRGMSGSLPLRAGSVHLDGQDLTNLRPDRALAHGMAHVLEGRQILATLSVEENLLVGARGVGREERDERVNRMFHVFPDLERLRKIGGAQLSGGQQQMLAIGRALMSNPRILLLDEPSLGLSPRLVEVVAQLLLKVRDDFGTSILIVEQAVWVALEVATRVYLMDRGNLGPGQDVAGLDARVLGDLYLGGNADGSNLESAS